MVKPIRTLALLLSVICILIGLIFIFPKGTIPLAGDIRLKYISLDDLLHPQEVAHADISQILKAQKALNADSLLEQANFELPSVPDTAELQAQKDSVFKQMQAEEEADVNALLSISYKIQIPESHPDVLKTFFAELDALAVRKGVVRIVHYGDSQIEGDRITSMIRYKMQNKFGGCGAGTIPVYDVADIRSSLKLRSSSNWNKYAIYGGLFKGAKTRNYGMQGNIFRIRSPALLDTLNLKKENKPQKFTAWTSFQQSGISKANTREFDKFRIYYGHTPKTTRLAFYYGDKPLFKDSLPAEAGFAMKSWPLDSFEKPLKVEFTGSQSPDLYGFGFDCKSGLAVDNVAMRGSSGLDFARLDMSYLAEQLNAMHTKLIILQFGVNVVPNVVDTYNWYEHSYYKQLKALREMLPGVSILVVSVTDMSTRENGNYVSYPNVVKIRDAQKSAAMRAGCAFWDLYEAMGGQNSMPSWVNASPALAEKDYTHFNVRGARIIGEMLYNALMSEYLAYKKNEKTK